MKFTDYYRILGVSPEATPDQIKTAYRKLARKYHPDVSKEPGTVKRFTDIGEAHDVLEDPVRRSAYDKIRAAGWKDGQEMHEQPSAEARRGRSGPGPDGQPDFSEFFESMFGRRAAGGRGRGPFRDSVQERGEDMHAAIQVSLEESFQGSQRELSLRMPEIDEHGEMRETLRTLSVKIPKGVVQGTQIRLRGQGHPGSSPDLNGDLYMEVGIAEHRLYRSEGSDVILEVPIAPWEAVLGAQVEVPTLGGMVTATIPAGAQQGQRLRLKGRGLPHQPPGDQYLELRIVVPSSSSEAVKDIYRTLAKATAGDARPRFGRQP